MNKQMQNMITALVIGGFLTLFAFLGDDILGFLSIEVTTLWEQIIQLSFWSGLLLIGIVAGALIMKKEPDQKLVISAVGIFGVVLGLGIPELYSALGWELSALLSNTMAGIVWIGIVGLIVGVSMYIMGAKNK